MIKNLILLLVLFDKETSGSSIKIENISIKELAEELETPVIRKFHLRKVHQKRLILLRLILLKVKSVTSNKTKRVLVENELNKQSKNS